MGTDKEWHVSCRDVTGKHRDVSVFADHDDIVVSTPPGETAVLTPPEVGQLGAALRSAARVAGGTADS